jgi:hypothetical protein
MESEQSLRGQGLHILARKDAVAIGFDGVGRQRAVAELDQFALNFLLFIGQKPLRIEIVTQPVIGFIAPHFLLSHGLSSAFHFAAIFSISHVIEW